jgi:hypothetical protein
LDLTVSGARQFCISANVEWRKQTLDHIRVVYVRRLREVAAGRSTPDGDLDLVAERAALAKVQRERIELELAEQRGEIVRVEDVLNTWAGHINTTKTALLGLPARIAGQIAGPGKRAEVEAVLRAEIKETLTELSTNGMPRKRGKDARSGVRDVDTAAGPDGEPVG